MTDENQKSPDKLAGNIAKKELLIEALSYIGHFKGKIVVIKYGGAAQTDPGLKESFAQDVVLLQSLGMQPVIVHGGGPEVSRVMESQGLKAEFVDGLRVTTAEGLAVTEMVLSGQINKDIVARINASGGWGVGLSGKDGMILQAHRMQPVNGVDLGLVGEIEQVHTELITHILTGGYIHVLSPIGMGSDGTTYNINGDSAASRLASALGAEKLVFMTDVDGVLNNGRLVREMTVAEANAFIESGVISGGMVPKVEAMIYCLDHGVKSAQIINGKEPHAIIAELFTDKGVGTQITP